MSETLLERSSRYIDDGVHEGSRLVNPIDATFHEVADDVAIVCGFSHIWALHTGEGLVVVDTSLPGFATAGVKHLNNWRNDPVHTIVYTHGHVDHVGGARVFVDDAAERGHIAPSVVGHTAVDERFDRYDLTSEYNELINQRQFNQAQSSGLFGPQWVRPDTTYRNELDLQIGDTPLRLMHTLGETDDHTVVWAPGRKLLFTGDLVCWFFPNAGNPQKVQRYPAEWAAFLRRMIDLEPEMLLPAHGLPIEGRDRIARVLDDFATALEGLVRDTLEMMNSGAQLDEIVHTVRVPQGLLDKPYLRPVYDEPEFVVRNIWRLYGGWYDGNPARLKPPSDTAVATEVASLAGGAHRLAARAGELSDSGDHRLACQVAEWAAQAAPDDPEVHEARASVYETRRDSELSLMARAIYADAARTSEAVVNPSTDEDASAGSGAAASNLAAPSGGAATSSGS